MTVLSLRRDPRSYESGRTRRNDPEPLLDDLLDDPILLAVMRRDHVERAEVERLVDSARRRLGFDQPRYGEADLYAECRT